MTNGETGKDTRIMTRAKSALPLTALPLDAASAVPMHRQLCDRLREAILRGQLTAGTRLPGTRTLAAELGISRNTVLNAFEQLLAEGYVEGKEGAGTYVACPLPDTLLQVGSDEDATYRSLQQHEGRRLSQRGEQLAAATFVCSHIEDKPRPFQAGLPALDLFPQALWSRLIARHWRHATPSLLGYGEAAGYGPLRETIAEYLRTARGVRCDASQVIVVAGSQQGLSLAAHLLLDPGEVAWVENPGYRGVRTALLSAGAQIVPVPLDEEGLDVEAGSARHPPARFVYVTPSHQYPTGVVMSLRRRVALLEWAEREGAWIIEDDYDSEFRYAGRPLSALQGLDCAGRVIYVGTFSKVLLPTLRLGYVVVPPDLVGAFTTARAFSDGHSPQIEQAVLTDFIDEGHFSHHIRRMRNRYEERQAALLQAAAQEAADVLFIPPTETGMQVVGWLPDGLDDRAVTDAAAARGVQVRSLASECLEPIGRSGILLGYGAIDPALMQEGMRRLAAAIHSVADGVAALP